ncbi:MAG: molybdopterin-dependent oxidoreductase [Nocardioidaceae bacterium]
MEKRLGVCNLCEAICGLEFTLDGDQIQSVRGNPVDPLSRGHICPKAVALQDIHADPDRLRRPVRRTSEGWVEVEWDEALDLVADRLAATQRAYGRDAVGVYLGNPNVHSLGAMTHGTHLVKMLRTRNRFSATSVDQLPHQLVAWLLYGHQLLVPVPDIDRTQYFLVFGANPMASNGSLMTVPDFPARLRELRGRGGSMVVFDPRRTETAKIADEHVFVRPGTDAAVLLAMLHTILAEGLDRIPQYAVRVDVVREAIADFTPERAAAVSGVAADTIRRVAREFAEAGAAACYGRVGVSTQRFGAVCQWAVQLLNLVTGNLDRPGGSMLTRPAVDVVGRGLLGRGHYARWRSRVRGLPEFAGELPAATMADEILTDGPGQVRAVLTVAGNPVLSTPDGARLGRALESLDFMAAVDFYVNETTRHADVILPPTSSLERDHYDLVFHLLAVRNTTRFVPALFAKQPGALHDWEIFREIGLRHARRTRAGGSLRRRLTSSARMRLSPTSIVDLLLASGWAHLSIRHLLRNPSGVDLGPLEPCLPRRLMTKDKRVDVAPALMLDDLDRVAEELLEGPAADSGLRLIGRRHQRDCNSWMHNTERLTRGRARHQLLMHPSDLADRGIEDGQVVRVEARVGRVEVEVQASEDMMRGVVSLPHGYGHQHDGVLLSVATAVDGVSVNDLTDPERLDDLSGNAVLNGVPVTVSPPG